jgi:membrane protein
VKTSRLKSIGKRLFKKVGEDDVSGAAAELAYRFFLAVFPFFIFLAALGGFAASALDVQNPTDEVMDALGDTLPEDAAGVLRTQLEGVLEERNSGLLSIGILGAVWAASSGIGALMKKTNVIFGVDETRPIWMKYAIAVGLTLAGAGLLLVAFSVFFAGQIYGPQIAGEVGLSGTTATLVNLARLPVAVLIILMAVAFLFWRAPNTNLPIKWLTPGAVFFALAWLVATLLFGFYVSNFSSYNATYGALGGVVVLLIWFYLTAFLLLLSAELNVVLAEEFDPEAVDTDVSDKRQRERETEGRTRTEGRRVPTTAALVESRRTGAGSVTAERRHDKPRRENGRAMAAAPGDRRHPDDGWSSATGRVAIGLATLLGAMALIRASRTNRNGRH